MKRARPLLVTLAKAAFIAFAYIAAAYWNPRRTWRQDRLVEIARGEATRYRWGPLSVWAGTAIFVLLAKIAAEDNAYAVYIDDVVVRYAALVDRDNRMRKG